MDIIAFLITIIVKDTSYYFSLFAIGIIIIGIGGFFLILAKQKTNLISEKQITIIIA